MEITKNDLARTMMSDVETLPDLSMAEKEMASINLNEKRKRKTNRQHSPSPPTPNKRRQSNSNKPGNNKAKTENL